MFDYILFWLAKAVVEVGMPVVIVLLLISALLKVSSIISSWCAVRVVRRAFSRRHPPGNYRLSKRPW